LIALCLTGCAKRDTFYWASQEVKQKKWASAYRSLEDSLVEGTADMEAKAQSMIKDYPEILSVGLMESFDEDLATIKQYCSEWAIKKIAFRLNGLKTVDFCNDEQLITISNRVHTIVNNCIKSGENEILLDCMYDPKCDIYDEESFLEAFKNQIECAKENSQYINNNIRDYVQEKGIDSEMGLYLKTSLSQIHWSEERNIRAIVKDLFPDYYAKIASKNRVVLTIKTDPPRPLLELDVVEYLNSYDLIEAVREDDGDGKTHLHLLIKEIALEEHQKPERTVQQYVPWSSMNVFTAVLAYPKNSTAIYDLTTGGYVIVYAYQIVMLNDGVALSDKIFRDKLERDYQYASNLRYRNVFGGIGVPSVYPNGQVEAIFRNSTLAVDAEELRKKVFDRLIEEIIKLDRIKEASLFGST
jgi:hypothetical protein